MKNNYNFVNKYKIELIVLLILILISICIYYFYYRENFISEGFGEDNTVKFTGIAGGEKHSIALTASGKVYAWGYNVDGQLGISGTTQQNTPVNVSSLNNIIGIASKFNHSLALTNDGKVYAWGRNNFGQLGGGSVSTPVPNLPNNIIGISCGTNHSLAVSDEGKVYTWGYNSNGQLGGGSVSTPVPNLPNNIIEIAGGNIHSLALTNDGQVYAWGYNGSGQLGISGTTQNNTPVHVSSLSNIIGIACGTAHSLALSNDGKVYAWGFNEYGQLGGGSVNSSIPTLPNNIIGIACGFFHSLAFTDDGKVYAWGYNVDGQLGGGSVSSSIPTLPHNIIGINGGDYHSLAFTIDGKVYAWGKGNSGQLGGGSVSSPITNPINCVGDFVNDGECSAPCGPGKQTQIYQITTPTQFGGTCPHQEGEETEIDCNIQPCPIDCEGSFGEYGSCSKTCGGGKKERVYTISRAPQYDGKECLNKTGDIDISDCNTQPCPIDCVGSFGDYGECNTTCGGGKQERVYTVTQESQYGGAECLNKPDDKEVIDCNTEPCPIDCKGEFLDFAPCSKECGKDGILLQKYNIINEAQYGGKKCPNYQDDLKSIPCNRQPCPTYPVNTVIQEALKESNNQIQNIRYDIINRQETLDLLTNKFNRLNKNISFLQNNSKYIPDDKTLKFY